MKIKGCSLDTMLSGNVKKSIFFLLSKVNWTLGGKTFQFCDFVSENDIIH